MHGTPELQTSHPHTNIIRKSLLRKRKYPEIIFKVLGSPELLIRLDSKGSR